MTRKRICILGLGYIGLPTAAMFASHGHEVVGVDIREDVIDAMNKGMITIDEPYLDTLVQAAVSSGNLIGRTKPIEADFFIIAVPTPITQDKKADMSYVVSATKSIVPYLRIGNTVVLESTSPIGTINKLICPILAESGLVVGKDLYVAHSPERVLPGQIIKELVYNNRIIGGINRESSEIVYNLYKTFVKGEIFITDATTAEMCKIIENTYRDVNIAFANEVALICEQAGVNAWDVIDLCNRHPRVNIHQPGPGVGGHCVAVDPWFITEEFPDTARMIRLARETNDFMPQHVYDTVKRILKDIIGQKTITILGITYKPDVDDMRESPVAHLVELIRENGEYNIRIYDPYIKSFLGLERDIIKAAAGSDLLLLGVNHKEFSKIDFNKISNVMRSRNVLDTRNFLDGEVLRGKGFNYYLLGSNSEPDQMAVDISA